MIRIHRHFPFVLILSLVAMLFGAPDAAAAEPPKLDAANTAWMLTASVLVLFMTLPGLALFYAGLVRASNVLSVLMQCFAITCVVTLAWVVVGYSIAFGDGGAHNAWYGGFAKTFMSGVDLKALKGSIPETVFAMFQLTFAIITPALVIGAYAERVQILRHASLQPALAAPRLLSRSPTGCGATAGWRREESWISPAARSCT